MSLAIVATLALAIACGNNTNKNAAEATEETAELCANCDSTMCADCDSCACENCDSTKCAACDSCACEQPVEE